MQYYIYVDCINVGLGYRVKVIRLKYNVMPLNYTDPGQVLKINSIYYIYLSLKQFVITQIYNYI